MATLDRFREGGEQGLSSREEALLQMTRTIASLVDRVQTEVAQEPLYEIE
jgi:hypothetical protein